MKDFKKLIKEAHLGNPLNEEDRFTRVDKILAKDEEYDDENLKGSKRYADVRADLEGEINEENEKWDKISKMEYGKPWMELSIAQKQELLSYMNRETEKQFQTDYERRRRGDYSDDMEDGMTDYQRRRMDEELKLGVKYELPTGETGYIMTGGSKDPKDWKFSANKESYLSVKDKLKPTKEQPGKYDGAYDMGMGKGHHVDEGTCGYGEDGVIGDKPAGAHLQKEDINDPVLVKARAAQMKRDAIDKKDLENKSKRISADKAIDLRYELSILNKEKEDILMRIEDLGFETDQTAEPEGGEKADDVGKRMEIAIKDLRDINSKIIDIKDDLGIFDMNESDLDEDLQLDVNLYNRENPGIFSKADEKVQVTIPGGFDDNEGDTALEKALTKLGKKYTSYKVKDVKELNEDEIDEELFTPNEMGDEAVEKEADSAAYESLQESLRKKLQDRLK